jgi:hypothetical protein
MRNKQKKWRRGHGMEYYDDQGNHHQLTNRQVKELMREYNNKAAPSAMFSKLMQHAGIAITEIIETNEKE